MHAARVVSGDVCRPGQRRPHTQVLFKEDEVEKNRPRSPDQQQPSRQCRRTPAPTHGYLGGSRPHGRLRDLEPRYARPRCSGGQGLRGGASGAGHAHHAPGTSGWPSELRWRAGAWGVGVTVRSGVGRGSGGHAIRRLARPCHTCGMPVNGRDNAIVGSMGRRCFSTLSSLSRTYVTDYNSSI